VILGRGHIVLTGLVVPRSLPSAQAPQPAERAGHGAGTREISQE
jgi:hypothetical protein